MYTMGVVADTFIKICVYVCIYIFALSRPKSLSWEGFAVKLWNSWDIIQHLRV